LVTSPGIEPGLLG